MGNETTLPPTFAHAVERIDAGDTARFGGKATGLARMVAAGIPVPPAFVIGTDGYRAFRAAGQLPAALGEQAEQAIAGLEHATGRRFGAADGFPLLVSVRSGAQISMPGMMDTVLNLGITGAGALALAGQSGNIDFALDTWVRFWRMFCDIVLGIDGDELAEAVAPAVDAARSAPSPASFAALEQAVLAALADQGEADVQADPRWQLRRAIAAVFESWDSRRARAYRAHHGIADDLGTAVTVQAMVFGNYDARSGSGVAFTRNPNSGEATLYGEFLSGRQGEDLVAGTATPQPLDEPGALGQAHQQELAAHGQQLEVIYRDAVDIEFTVEGDRLYFLQVRPAKRTAQAAVRIATELVDDGIATPDEALTRVSVDQLKRLLRPAFEPAALEQSTALVSGIGASPGHAFGIAVLDADRAAAAAAGGEKVIFLRPTTSPQDIRGMLSSQAIVTARGGALSHAAVVSRALDIPCVVGCTGLEIDADGRRFAIGTEQLEEGAPLSVDGATGRVFSGILPLEGSAQAGGHIDRLLGWSDARSGARVWIADIHGGDARAVLQQQATGVGVVGLTDLLIAAGTVGQLVEAINTLSEHPDSTDNQERIAQIAYEASRQLLLGCPGLPVDLRLPHLGSPRARQLISTWASLAPRLFLPLGLKGLYVSLLRGIAAAARETGHRQVTPLIAAITSPRELAAFRQAAAEAGLERVGAVLQSPAGVAAAPSLAAPGTALWVDIGELIRTSHGFLSALSFGDDVFENYVAEGLMEQNPRTRLAPLLRDGFEGLVRTAEAATDCRLGIECREATAMSLVEDLYAAGLRTFSVPAATASGIRLRLGQLATKERT